MKKYFICLANSKKYSERCIAGIELLKGANGYNIVKYGYKPKWLRPVTQKDHGQVEAKLVAHIQLFDIVEIEIIREVANGYQPENILFYPKSIRVFDKKKIANTYLRLFCNPQPELLFGNNGRAVAIEKMPLVKHSIELIKISDAHIYSKLELSYLLKYRLQFLYLGTANDLPITDVHFIQQLGAATDASFLQEIATNIHYITVSLGLEHEGWHYKLVAGVFVTELE